MIFQGTARHGSVRWEIPDFNKDLIDRDQQAKDLLEAKVHGTVQARLVYHPSDVTS